MAEQRGALFMHSTRYMRLARLFMGSPSPLADADDGLVGGYAHMLVRDFHALLAG